MIEVLFRTSLLLPANCLAKQFTTRLDLVVDQSSALPIEAQDGEIKGDEGLKVAGSHGGSGMVNLP